MRTAEAFGACVEHQRNRVLCACRGMLTYDSFDDFRPLIAAVVARPNAEIVLDLARVSFLDSSGLGMLLVLKNKAETMGGRLRLVNMQPRIERILHHTGVRTMLCN